MASSKSSRPLRLSIVASSVSSAASAFSPSVAPAVFTAPPELLLPATLGAPEDADWVPPVSASPLKPPVPVWSSSSDTALPQAFAARASPTQLASSANRDRRLIPAAPVPRPSPHVVSIRMDTVDASNEPVSGYARNALCFAWTRKLEQHFEEFVEFVPGGVLDRELTLAVFVANFDFGAELAAQA